MAAGMLCRTKLYKRPAMKKLLCMATCAALVAACSKIEAPKPAPAPPPPALISGIDIKYIDHGVRPQDDFYRYVNGKWLAVTQIPPDRGRYGAFTQLQDDSLTQQRDIIDGLQKAVSASDPDQQKIAALYASFMDEAALEQLGMKPLDAQLAKVDALKDKADIPALIAHFNEIGVTAPYSPGVHQDAKDSTKYVFDLGQDGLGMPDRDYYLQNNPQLQKIRKQYGIYVQKMLTLAGDAQAARDATNILALETTLAKAQWTKVQNRDPVKTYNKYPFAKLTGLAPGYDWKAYLADSGVGDKTDYLVISQPSYITAFNRILRATPLTVWKAYFRWHLLNDYAPYLSKAFVDAHFDFNGTALRGIQQNQPRWKRGVQLVDTAIGEALGRLYVARYFPPASKARMDQLVNNLIAAYRADIGTLDWMGPQTRQKAAREARQVGD